MLRHGLEVSRRDLSFRFLCSCSGAFVDSYFVAQEALEEFLEDGLCNLICEENVTG